MNRDGLPLTHFPVCLSGAFMVIPFRKGGKMKVTHFLRCHRRPDGVKEEGQGRELCCLCFLHCTCLAEVTLTSGGHWPLSPQKGPGEKKKSKGTICRKLPSECSWQTLTFPSKNAFRGGSQGQTTFSLFLPVITFCLRKPHLGVSCLSSSTDSDFYFLFHVPILSFPYHYPPWFRLCIFCSVLLSCLPLALAGVSLPFRALSSPCRTRPRKAASAQSSRSGGEGGNVHVGMDSKHRWVGACWAPTTSSPSSMCVRASSLLWPQTVM